MSIPINNLKVLINTENILYSYTKKYKLADLGLSRLTYRTQGEDIIEGDSRYMAPELLKEVDPSGKLPDLRKADIFSLGTTIYELMIGRLQYFKIQIPNFVKVMSSLKMEMSGMSFVQESSAANSRTVISAILWKSLWWKWWNLTLMTDLK